MAEETPFFEKVYQVARQIPKGKVTSYGIIAKCIGTPKAARMVGWAMNNAHQQSEYVPAHRVVNRKGLLSGKHHFGEPNKMQQLLEAEGFTIIDNQIVDFEQYLWDPFDEDID